MDDERNSGRRATAAARGSGPASREFAISASLERLRRIPGFGCAVVQTKDGNRVGDESPEGELFSGQVQYLSIIARQLGDIFGAGELQSAAVQGTNHHLLLFATRSHYLGVLAKATSPLGAVEAEVRKSLAENTP